MKQQCTVEILQVVILDEIVQVPVQQKAQVPGTTEQKGSVEIPQAALVDGFVQVAVQ